MRYKTLLCGELCSFLNSSKLRDIFVHFIYVNLLAATTYKGFFFWRILFDPVLFSVPICPDRALLIQGSDWTYALSVGAAGSYEVLLTAYE
jgi:hypothetical protein